MKYIRTKDGIYKLDDEWALFCKDHVSNQQANTIEELCDEYVVEDNYYSAIFNNLKLARQTKGTCYGAIRTEWGLKYVAKINKEGKWELL